MQNNSSTVSQGLLEALGWSHTFRTQVALAGCVGQNAKKANNNRSTWNLAVKKSEQMYDMSRDAHMVLQGFLFWWTYSGLFPPSFFLLYTFVLCSLDLMMTLSSTFVTTGRELLLDIDI